MDAEKNPTLSPGATFRGLTIHSLLGSGAMGSVYLASHPILQIPLIIKTFKQFVDQDIFREAYLAARVTSPFTVKVVDAGFEDGCPFVVQSYVDGIDLQELATRSSEAWRRIPVDMVVRLVLDACHGFHAIHQAGVIHRDVKPANLFLRGDGTATVGDFGIALPAQPTGPVMAVGTPPFMPPEQWQNDPLDRRVDIYALGATAHYLATGTYPFKADTVEDLRTAHMDTRYVPPPTFEPREAYLFSVITRMLLKQPEKRYPTAAAVADALATVVQPVSSYARLTECSFRIGGLHLRISVGDMTKVEADVIVNAANTGMTMKLGLAAALLKAGGESIETEALAQAPACMGDVVWTGAGTLRARFIAHAVAALGGAVCVQRCVLRVLLEAEKRRLRSVALPALGTGVGRVPVELAAQLMLEAIRTFADLKPAAVQNVDIVLHGQPAHDTWLNIINAM
jgi:O-acetyl-ADP-ribose deacetylase (regulator of RNase III)